jgi:hypothetical protein
VGALDDAAVMRGDGGIDQTAPHPLIRDKVRSSPALASGLWPTTWDRRELSGDAHSSGTPALRIAS